MGMVPLTHCHTDTLAMGKLIAKSNRRYQEGAAAKNRSRARWRCKQFGIKNSELRIAFCAILKEVV